MKAKYFLYLGLVIVGAAYSEYIPGLVVAALGLFLLLLETVKEK